MAFDPQSFTLAPDSVIPNDRFANEEDAVKKAADQSAKSRSALESLQKEQDRLTKMFGGTADHPPTLRDQVKSGKISGTDYFRLTGRIWGGAPQAKGLPGGTPGLDALHAMNSPGAGPIGGASLTPGLDNFHKINPPPASVIPSPSGAAAPAVPKEILGPFPQGQAQRQFATPYGNIGVTGGPLNPQQGRIIASS